VKKTAPSLFIEMGSTPPPPETKWTKLSLWCVDHRPLLIRLSVLVLAIGTVSAFGWHYGLAQTANPPSLPPPTGNRPGVIWNQKGIVNPSSQDASFDVTDAGRIGQNLTVGGTADITGRSSLRGGADVTGTLAVTQDLTVGGGVTMDGSTLKLDKTNNRVGINTNTPATDLDVNGRVAARTSLCLGDPAISTNCKGAWSDVTSVTPNLQQVTTAGNTTTSNVKVGKIGVDGYWPDSTYGLSAPSAVIGYYPNGTTINGGNIVTDKSITIGNGSPSVFPNIYVNGPILYVSRPSGVAGTASLFVDGFVQSAGDLLVGGNGEVAGNLLVSSRATTPWLDFNSSVATPTPPSATLFVKEIYSRAGDTFIDMTGRHLRQVGTKYGIEDFAADDSAGFSWGVYHNAAATNPPQAPADIVQKMSLTGAGDLTVAGKVTGTTGLCIGSDCKTAWSQVGSGGNFVHLSPTTADGGYINIGGYLSGPNNSAINVLQTSGAGGASGIYSEATRGAWAIKAVGQLGTGADAAAASSGVVAETYSPNSTAFRAYAHGTNGTALDIAEGPIKFSTSSPSIILGSSNTLNFTASSGNASLSATGDIEAGGRLTASGIDISTGLEETTWKVKYRYHPTTGTYIYGLHMGSGNYIENLVPSSTAGFSWGSYSGSIAQPASTDITRAMSLTGLGNLTVRGTITTNSNISGSGISASGAISGSSISTTGNITASGTVTGTGGLCIGTDCRTSWTGATVPSLLQILQRNADAGNFVDAVNLGGPLAVGGGLTNGGFLSVAGWLSTTSYISASGNISSSGNISASGNLSASGTIRASSHISGQDLTARGTFILSSNKIARNEAVRYYQTAAVNVAETSTTPGYSSTYIPDSRIEVILRNNQIHTNSLIFFDPVGFWSQGNNQYTTYDNMVIKLKSRSEGSALIWISDMPITITNNTYISAKFNYLIVNR